jgi:hypothetical protein
VVEHREYYDTELAERRDRLVLLDVDPSEVPMVDGGLDAAAAGDIFGEGDGEEEGYQEDAEGPEQGGLGYQ